MKELENSSEAAGVSKSVLMENAGAAVAMLVAEKMGYIDLEGGATILCGEKNNAGDGFCAALNINEMGIPVTVILLCGEPATGIAYDRYEQVLNTPGITVFLPHNDISSIFSVLSHSGVIIDAVFGTGFKPERGLPETVRICFDYVKHTTALKIAVDLPSGGDALTGECDVNTFKADYTVTFAFPKTGMGISPLQTLCGEIITADIGVPKSCISKLPIVDDVSPDFKKIFHKRKIDSYKYDFGRVLCIMGSSRMSGAAQKAVKSAFRSGCGLITLASSKEVIDRIGGHIPQSMFYPLSSDKNGFITSAGVPVLLKSGYDVVAVGCGMGVTAETQKVVSDILKSDIPVKIIDADGINALSENIELLKEAKGTICLTPHAAELARLCGVTASEAAADRSLFAAKLAREYGVYVLAKGVPNFIASPDGSIGRLFAGNPALAKGGSGDCLAGILAGIFAGNKKTDATAAEIITGAVALHGLAADIARDKFTEISADSGDVIDSIHLALIKVLKG